MLKQRNIVSAVLVVVAMFAIGTIVGTAVAQKTVVPKPQDRVALGEEQVRQLLLLMDTDENGKISKQEWMRFMEAEFDRLDKKKTGELDVKELKQSKLQAADKKCRASAFFGDWHNEEPRAGLFDVAT